MLVVGLVAGFVCLLYGNSAIAALMGICAVAAFCAISYKPWTTEIAVTNLRLIYKRGLLDRQTNDLQLRAIEEVQLHQGFLGRLFNYGNIEFRGTGVDDLKLPALNDPIIFQKAVQEAIGAHQNEAQLPGHSIINVSQGPLRARI